MNQQELVLHVPLMSKARPRAFRGQTTPYMPAPYKKWKKEVQAQMSEWWTDPPLEVVNVVWMKFAGPARSDLDNLMGAILDAGNKILWRDDRVSIIRRLHGQWEKAPTNEQSIHIKMFWE